MMQCIEEDVVVFQWLSYQCRTKWYHLCKDELQGIDYKWEKAQNRSML